jgi:hypothetical protein
VCSPRQQYEASSTTTPDAPLPEEITDVVPAEAEVEAETVTEQVAETVVEPTDEPRRRKPRRRRRLHHDGDAERTDEGDSAQ